MFPSLEILEKIQWGIKFAPNQKKESKRREYWGVFLLCYGAGLRVSEAIGFDLAKKNKKGLYFVKSKGDKTRLVYIPAKIIRELKKHNWKPNQTNRFNFYQFLKRVKRELAINKAIELTPHTLRRAFATYYAENGLPLPLLQKLLGHSSIRTTALYWINIYSDDDSDSILIAKNWPQKPKNPPIEPEQSIKIGLDLELPELFAPPASELQFDYSTKFQQLEKQLSQVQTENNDLKNQNTSLQKDLDYSNKQNIRLNHEKNQAYSEKEKTHQELITAKQTIQKLEQALATTQKSLVSEKTQRITAQNNLNHANQINNNLQQQLQIEKEANINLTAKLNHSQQNHTNLLNIYQNLTQKQQATQNQLNYYENQLKAITLMLQQWQKINYYHQQEKSNQFETKIIQPPPWK